MGLKNERAAADHALVRSVQRGQEQARHGEFVPDDDMEALFDELCGVGSGAVIAAAARVTDAIEEKARGLRDFSPRTSAAPRRGRRPSYGLVSGARLLGPPHKESARSRLT